MNHASNDDNLLTDDGAEPIDRIRFFARVLIEEVVRLELDSFIFDSFREFSRPVRLPLLKLFCIILQHDLECRHFGVHLPQDMQRRRAFAGADVDEGSIRLERLPGVVNLRSRNSEQRCRRCGQVSFREGTQSLAAADSQTPSIECANLRSCTGSCWIHSHQFLSCVFPILCHASTNAAESSSIVSRVAGFVMCSVSEAAETRAPHDGPCNAQLGDSGVLSSPHRVGANTLGAGSVHLEYHHQHDAKIGT